MVLPWAHGPAASEGTKGTQMPGGHVFCPKACHRPQLLQKFVAGDCPVNKSQRQFRGPQRVATGDVTGDEKEGDMKGRDLAESDDRGHSKKK